MNTKNITIGVLVAVAIVFGVFALKSPTVVQVPTSLKFDSSVLGTQKAPNVTVEAAKPVVVPAPVVNVNVPKQTQTLGSVASPDIMSPYFSVGGVRQWFGKTETLVQASSTVCAIQAPAATTTFVGGSIRFTLASTSAVTVDIAKGDTRYATTTKIGSSIPVAAGAQSTIVASTTASSAGDGITFAPSQWFVVRWSELSWTSGAGNAPTGVCQVVWREI